MEANLSSTAARTIAAVLQVRRGLPALTAWSRPSATIAPDIGGNYGVTPTLQN